MTGQPWPPMPQALLAPVGRTDSRRSAARRLPGQSLSGRRADGPAPGPRRGGLLPSGGLGLAGRHRRLPDRRPTAASGPTASLRLASGDVCVLAGEARLAFHGVDRIIPGSSHTGARAAGGSTSPCGALPDLVFDMSKPAARTCTRFGDPGHDHAHPPGRLRTCRPSTFRGAPSLASSSPATPPPRSRRGPSRSTPTRPD